MHRPAGLLIAIAAIAFAGCSRHEKSSDPAPAKTAAPAPAAPTTQANAGDGVVDADGRHRNLQDWNPAEFKGKRGRRWKDPAVYVDGREVGVLWFGELPRSLKPTWINDVEDLDFKPGDKGPRTRPIKVRRYRLDHYLEVVGVDIGKVKRIHIYGGKGNVSDISGAQLRKFRKTIQFGFGRLTSGKAIPYYPEGLQLDQMFDRMVGVAVYIDKAPPKLDKDDYPLGADGQPTADIPYFGKPIRGGIRVYKDDVLATTIKRKRLDPKAAYAVHKDNGELWYDLVPTLESLGVDMSKVVDAEVVFDERRVKIIHRDELLKRQFTATSQNRGAIQLDDGTVVEALTLYTKKLPGPFPPISDDE